MSATSDKTTPPKIAPPTRRTQAERRAATRQKILDATIVCLARDGFSGSTISRIVTEAQVSHGASGHLFDNKNAMLLAAADEAFWRFYRRWQHAILSINQAEDRLKALLAATWIDLLHGIENEVLLELLIAGKQDPEFNAHLQPLFNRFLILFQHSAEHFFESISPDIQVEQMMMLTQWLFRGMALDKRITPSAEYFAPYIQAWVTLLRSQIQARHDVHSPPPTAI